MENKERNLKKASVYDLLKRAREIFAQEQELKNNSESKNKFFFSLFPKTEKEKMNIITGEIPFSWEKIMDYSNEEFIINAYRWVLKRDPDPQGQDYFLSSLENNKMTRVEVLGRLKFSQEGKKQNIHIKGLTPRLFIHLCYKIPILCFLLKLIISFLMLPHLNLKIQNIAIFWKKKISSLEKNQETIIKCHNNFSKEILEIKKKLSDKVDHSLFVEIKKEMANKADFSIFRAQQEILRKIENEILKISNKLNYIEKFINELPSQSFNNLKITNFNLPSLINIPSKDKNRLIDAKLLDLLYYRLEEKFRGSREQVKEWQKIYLKYINKSDAGKIDSPILDLGCGRGEWLELLKENGYKAVGVDLNIYMAEVCKEYGLDVVNEDILVFLASQKEKSWGAVTAFHLIEHFSFDNLIILLEEMFRILKSGGLLILETPNPENMHIGSWFFYQDPTHRNPIPPNTLEFLVAEQGFLSIEIIRLRPLAIYGLEDSLINKMFFGPTEYALIAQKP